MDSLSLPLASIVKILKEALPANVSVSKEVKLSLQRAAALFVLYVTNTANQLAKEGKRSTITADDVMAALEELEFEPLLEPLEGFLEKWRKQHEKFRQKIKEAAQASRARAAAAAAAAEAAGGEKKKPASKKGNAKKRKSAGDADQENEKTKSSPAKKAKGKSNEAEEIEDADGQEAESEQEQEQQENEEIEEVEEEKESEE